MESRMLRTACLTLLLTGLGVLLVHFSIGAAAGNGESIFRSTAAAAALLASAAAACRRFRWLSFPLVLASLCALALLVDQLAYFDWHDRVDGFVSGVERSVESGSPGLTEPMNVRP